jgi:hypothetical protein
MAAANDMGTSEMFCSVSSEATQIMVYSDSSRKYAEVGVVLTSRPNLHAMNWRCFLQLPKRKR